MSQEIFFYVLNKTVCLDLSKASEVVYGILSILVDTLGKTKIKLFQHEASKEDASKTDFIRVTQIALN